MPVEQSVWFYFINASIVVKSVMAILLLASLVSWTVIFQRWLYLRQLQKNYQAFDNLFWSGADLGKLYEQLKLQRQEPDGIAGMFLAGFREFCRIRQAAEVSPTHLIEGVQRAMRIVYSKSLNQLENHLSLLATIGSTTPYIGLFGTVWGIMASFHALGTTTQASIAMVAPGISEALVATAMGLFAAIPAVIAYNRYANRVDRILNQYDTFQEEFTCILYRQALQPVTGDV